MEKFEEELTTLQKNQGVNPERNPIRWIKWENELKDSNGIRAPIWRQAEGDIGYILASTHDQGIVVILCKKDGTCNKIKGYSVDGNGEEQLDYSSDGSSAQSLTDCLSSISSTFRTNLEKLSNSENTEDQEEDTTKIEANDDLKTLPQAVLTLTPPVTESTNDDSEEKVQEDDEPVVSYPRQIPNLSQEPDYWGINAKMTSFVANSADPDNTDLIEVASNPYLREPNGQRAVLDAHAIPAILGILRMKQQQHVSESKQGQQIEAALNLLAQISISPNVRRQLANDTAVQIFLEILNRNEARLNKPLFDILANSCHNTKFRELLIKRKGVNDLVLMIQKPDTAEAAAYVLWTLNRSYEATHEMEEQHLLIGIPSYFTMGPDKIKDTFQLNLTRLLYSLAYYSPDLRTQMTQHEIEFFCNGLGATNSLNGELAAWSAKVFTIYQITQEQQKIFINQQCDGPAKLIRILDSKDPKVILAGLECISIIGEILSIRDAICSGGILSRLTKLWKHENLEVKKLTLKVIGILTLNDQCARWTVKEQLIPGLLEYLHNTDPDFVIYSAKAIGTCCSKKENLDQLMHLNGVRMLWSLMKSPYSGVQAAATKALVPFLKDPSSPAIVRTFVDGLVFLVDLLKSNDPDVQASACMAISEIAKDKENLAVMTDLGLVELLSRLLVTKLDSVRKPLADAIGVSANYGNNRRKFGEEGAVDPLVSYLRPPSNNKNVHAATAKALKALSEDPENSNKLRHAGVVDNLLLMVESKEPDLQMAAAVAIRNIRTNCVKINQD